MTTVTSPSTPFGDFGTYPCTCPPRALRARPRRRGHEGDDSAALEEAQDALARSLHELLDIFLAGRGRGVEHLALAIGVRRVHTVEKNGVQMWVKSEVTVGALDDCHGAGLARRQAAVDVPAPIPPRYSVREDAHHLPKQRSVEGEGKSQREGHRYDKLS